MVLYKNEPLTGHPCSRPMARECVATLPASYFSDPKVFNLELQAIWSREWIYACHENRLRMTSPLEMTLATFPISLCLSESGSVAGSLNALTGKPDSRRIHTHVLNGFVFVNFSDAPPPFESTHVGLADEFKSVEHVFTEAEFDFWGHLSLPGAFNWKVFSDNYNECYHCPTSHPQFSKVYKIPSYVVDAREGYFVHSVEERQEGGKAAAASNASVTELLLTESNESFPMEAKRLYDESYSALNQKIKEYAKANPPRARAKAHEGGLFVHVFPNVGINVFGDFVTTLRWNPASHEKTLLQLEVFVRKGVSEAEMLRFSNFLKWVEIEDYVLCEATQKNLALGVYQVGVLHPFRENGLVHSQAQIRKRLVEYVSQERELKEKVGKQRDSSTTLSEESGTLLN
ncbi:Bet v1-like protein [Gonapodya prolifera JEL478]|uniref:Choline monooxygenase, chloroplastic n=1 Tax=Gonapodya prolifera (strain JEL478) TaxID=1344416 RepID=A0A139AXP2_GONPJ|nr:Bet v1-like protein [Gonapodya prolifera JEL478]|eukprot:KXS21474.1 Bet v1-like protein [Gonapodya prolifera JEL478]